MSTTNMYNQYKANKAVFAMAENEWCELHYAKAVK